MFFSAFDSVLGAIPYAVSIGECDGEKLNSRGTVCLERFWTLVKLDLRHSELVL